MRLTRCLLCVAFVLLALMLLPPTAAQPGAVPVFEPAACPFDLPAGQVEGETVECGYVVVPEVRSDPESRMIRLAVAIFRHPDGNPEADPIIYLEGGPGGSPLKVRLPGFDAFFGPLLPANRDLIVFDQRGVGYSQPALECPDFSRLYLEMFDLELEGQRLSRQDVLERRVQGLAACAEDLRAVADLSAYHTAANAADVNDVRVALGYDRVNLWGSSYGSRLALEVMRAYPEGVRSVMLDAPYPPETDIYLAAPDSFERALDALFTACAADPDCNGAYPDLRAVFFDAIRRLDENPVATNVLNPYTRARWPVLMDGAMFVEQIFRGLYATDLRPMLPQIIYDAREGRFDTLLLITRLDVLRQDFRSWGMYFSVLCHDEVPFSDWGAFQSAAADRPEFAGFYTAFEVGQLPYRVCPQWGAGTADARANARVVSDIPTLITTGEYDPIVPPTFGSSAAETLTNSYSYVFPGVGHGALPAGDCPTAIMLDFLADPTRTPDESCLATMTVAPFLLPAATGIAVEMEPFANEMFGLEGLAPAGWTEAGPGVYARGSSATDVASLIQQAAPMPPAELLNVITRQLGLDEAPASSGERDANGMSWTLYSAEVQGVAVEFALAESGETTLIVVLNAPQSEHDALYEQVFMTALEALILAE